MEEKDNFKIIAKTIYGFEDLLLAELETMGAKDLEKGRRMVSFNGNLELVYKCNLACRTAIKILKPIFQFHAFTEQSLYENIQKIDWTKYLKLNQTFAIDATVHSEHFNHSLYVSQKTKDAIADQFRGHFNERPSVDLKNPDIRINIHINEHEVSVALDSSGESLNKRGYRKSTNVAPMNEVLAAGLIILSNWDKTTDFLDPMCGSGTILIEAAMIAQKIPPNFLRNDFAFMKWNDWDAILYNKVKKELNAAVVPLKTKIKGYDKDEAVVEKAKSNIELAGFESIISVEHKDFFETQKDNEEPLHILFNPPYNERIDVETENFYKQIGDTFKKNYPGTTAWFVTANLDGLKYVGLKASRRIVVANGQLEARLAKYDIYAGTKKQPKAPENE